MGVQQQTRAQKKRLSELKDSSFEIMHADKQKELKKAKGLMVHH